MKIQKLADLAKQVKDRLEAITQVPRVVTKSQVLKHPLTDLQDNSMVIADREVLKKICKEGTIEVSIHNYIALINILYFTKNKEE